MRISFTTLAALGAAASISCGSPAGPTGPTQDPGATGTTGSVKPLTVHKQQSKNHAIILGTDAKGGTAKVALADGESKATVDVMWVKRTTPATGGSTPTTLVTTPQDDGAVRVGVIEQFSGGVGSQSRASVWISSFLAATTLGHDLTDFKFTAEIEGFIDGPSAGGLYTAGYLAALTGTRIDTEATMTGTVNPDGTVGPVAGIPQKFEASLKKGKKRLGYPIGSRYAVDVNTGKPVDLHKLAEDAGAEAREVRDIYDAYELMTGKTLPRPVPVPAGEMELSSDVNQILKDKYQVWVKFFGGDWDAIRDISKDGKMALEFQKLALVGLAEFETAKQAYTEGLFATAYSHIREAVVYAAAAKTGHLVVEKVRARDVTGAGKLIMDEANAAVEVTRQAMTKVGKLHPTTISGHLQMISSFQKATSALGFAVWASDALGPAAQAMAGMAKPKAGGDDAWLPGKGEGEPTRAQLDDFAVKLSPGILNLTRGQAWALAAVESLEIEAVESIDYSCSEPAARQLAKSYASAALANLRYFESILVQQIADQFSLSMERAKSLLGKVEPNYVAATTAMAMSLGSVPFVAKLKEQWGEESLAWSLQTFGGSVMGYFKSSLLISSYYSLVVQKDSSTGKATAVQHKKAFMNMIESAERTAREHAHAAKVAVGSIPLQARLEYARARVLREGDIDAKLRALEGFWASSSYSRTAVVMARHVINPKKHGAHGN